MFCGESFGRCKMKERKNFLPYFFSPRGEDYDEGDVEKVKKCI